MEPVVLFGIQFTLSLLIYALIAVGMLAPRLSKLPTALALAPLLWVHAFRVVGGTILAPGAADPAVPADFRTLVGYGDMITAFLAILALLALRSRVRGAILLVWVFLVFAQRILAMRLCSLCAIVSSTIRWDQLGDRDGIRPSATCQQYG